MSEISNLFASDNLLCSQLWIFSNMT